MRNFEPIVLTVALALLALTAAGLAYTLPGIEELTGIGGVEANGHMPQAVKADALAAELQPWTAPAAWNVPATKARIFKSDGYFFYPSLYPSGNYIQKDDGTATTPGGILISWCQKYNLDITDPNIDREDPDKDGFSNKAEFFSSLPPGTTQSDGSKSTNPLDANDHPSYLSRLRLQNFDVQPFHIQFVGVVNLNGANLFQIALTDVAASGQPPLKKTGDALGYENWMVGVYTPKLVQEKDSATGEVTTVDRSTLELDKPDIGLKVILTLREVVNAPDSTANFVMLMPTQLGQVIKVPQGKTFDLPLAPPGSTYLVIDVNDTGAVIRDTKTQQSINVPKLDPNEWNDVPVPPTAPTK